MATPLYEHGTWGRVTGVRLPDGRQVPRPAEGEEPNRHWQELETAGTLPDLADAPEPAEEAASRAAEAAARAERQALRVGLPTLLLELDDDLAAVSGWCGGKGGSTATPPGWAAERPGWPTPTCWRARGVTPCPGCCVCTRWSPPGRPSVPRRAN